MDYTGNGVIYGIIVERRLEVNKKKNMLNPKFEELEKCFTACLELEGTNIPMSEALNDLKIASENLTTHWGNQWRKHQAVREYLKSKEN